MKGKCGRASMVFVVLMLLVALIVSCAPAQQGGAAQSLNVESALDRVKDRGTLRVCTYPGFPPGSYKDTETGEVTGIDPDLAREMAAALEVDIEFVESTWEGLIPALQSDKCDILMSNMSTRPARAESVTFAEHNILFNMGIAISGEFECGEMADWDTPDRSFCVAEGTFSQYTVENYFPNATTNLLTDQEGCWLEFSTGKADAAAGAGIELQWWILEHPELEAQVCFAQGVGLGGIPSAPAVPYMDLEFKTWVDVFMDTMINSGRYAEIYEKHMGEKPDLQGLVMQR